VGAPSFTESHHAPVPLEESTTFLTYKVHELLSTFFCPPLLCRGFPIPLSGMVGRVALSFFFQGDPRIGIVRHTLFVFVRSWWCLLRTRVYALRWAGMSSGYPLLAPKPFLSVPPRCPCSQLWEPQLLPVMLALGSPPHGLAVLVLRLL